MSQPISKMMDPKEGPELSQQPNASMNPETPKSAKVSAKKIKGKNDKGKSVPRQDSPQAIDPRNFTTPRPDQSGWSWTDLPDILYQFEPEDKRDRKSDPPRMRYPIHGEYLRDLPILPDNIASTVEEFRVEAWMRLDRRIRLRDITDRMHPVFRIQDNALQQRSVRFRQQFSLIAWDSGNKRSRQLKQGILQKMQNIGLSPALNTTRGITPGLVNPALGEDGGRIPLPNQYNKVKRVARGRKPSKTPVQEETATEHAHHKDIIQRKQPAGLSYVSQESASVAKGDTLRETVQEGPAVVIPSTVESVPIDFTVDDLTVETVAGLFNYVPSYIPFDENNDSPEGSLPVITGVIPDNELPETVSMAEIDLTVSIKDPMPRRKTEKTLKPIAPGKVQRRRPSPLKLARGGFCGNACHLGKHPTPIYTNLTLVSGQPGAGVWHEELLPPSHGLYPDVLTPYSASDLPFGVRHRVFDSLFEQCLSRNRYLFDIPDMAPEDMEMMDIGDINDINIDDYDYYFQK
ncbi:hypothetical protein ANOM_009694 [Aspergillus nomiae NRRL 13137]|uniref:Uncharacterized protein n=1 Tax=Aspergillus nomiae NRRL (strain ATCC 15546 / NRRL 13137 / CBS 260.88 / M93) TaxID=1509407 RepID=A0A0L1ITL5_ASPN3|nr:uncharacterized protein ANOM_009694 [Aspergillus nomiae NRRL 13137]KNG82508.1 hypothetical protein ANOM_009694 [Aspergillus nomiae NRRL 13137]